MDKSREWAEADGKILKRESVVVGLERVAKGPTENTFLERRDLAKSRAIRTRSKDRRKDIFFSLSLNQESMFSFQEERFEYFKSFEFSNHSLETSIKRFRGDLSILVAKTYLERKIHLGVKLC